LSGYVLPTVLWLMRFRADFISAKV
jgi:hypothetical protein